MCDIWKANNTKTEINADLIDEHIAIFKAWKVREVVFSGGEPLMHKNLWALCEHLEKARIRRTLLSTGLLLEKNAAEIVKHISNVIISIDGPEPVHDAIRNVPAGFAKIRQGIRSLRELKPHFRITGRSVLQRMNFHSFSDTVRAAKDLGLDQISFLAADVSSRAFNHTDQHEDSKDITLSTSESSQLEAILRSSFDELKDEYDTGFIAESPERVLRIATYYKALNGVSAFPRVVCNAPWVSAVIESNGDIMPCFFHKPYGNIYEDGMEAILNSSEAIRFRKKLRVKTDSICQRCVCTLKLGVTQML